MLAKVTQVSNMAHGPFVWTSHTPLNLGSKGRFVWQIWVSGMYHSMLMINPPIPRFSQKFVDDKLNVNV
jgi:hypothetical protein